MTQRLRKLVNKKTDLAERFRGRHVQISEHLQSNPIKHPESKNTNCYKSHFGVGMGVRDALLFVTSKHSEYWVWDAHLN